MADRYADDARAFLARCPTQTDPPEYLVYAFLATHCPDDALSPAIVSRLAWSIRMLSQHGRK